MNAATRKKLLAYAIPADLVVLATGIGLLVPGLPAIAIIWLYVIAVALSAWKSGWPGAIAAIVLSCALLLLVFRTSVPRDQIGMLIAAGVAASIPLAALRARRVRIKFLRAQDALLFFEPTSAAPQSIEEAAAGAILDPAHLAEREALARAEGERIASQRFAVEKARIEAEHADRLKVHQAELDAARLALDAERAELKQRPPIIEKQIDEEALAERLEHLRAELQQQFLREMQPRIDAALAQQRETLARDSDREIAKVRQAAEERVAAVRAELERVVAQPAPAKYARPPVQRGILSRFFHPRPKPMLQLNREIVTKPEPVAVADEAPRKYDVTCANCHVVFDAAESDWCSCLTRDRTVVCTNCLTCFCNSPPAYKEIFWSDAPPQLLDRKAAELRSQSLSMAGSASASDVRRPLVMLVDSDPDNQAIIQRVCANLGYGAVSSDGQDALAIARSYRPNLILADAILPRLDGRELCRLLKEDPAFAATKFVVISGLYTDTKFKRELMQRFGIDDCLATPVSITDLINLLQRHLEGVRDLPAQENLYDQHRKVFGAPLDARTSYEIACVNCGDMFDAVKAAWCACADGDHTLACEHCGGCFCDAADYRRRFWAGAPAVLFERKTLVEPTLAETTSDKRPLVAVIDDDPSAELLVRTIASTLGYGVAGYANAGQAMTQKPDLIFVDALLSRHDNRSVARRLKDVASNKVIVMSGRAADPEFRHDAAARFKADDCLARPLAAADIIEALKKYLPQARTSG
ncbi:MAG TPA: response regulator [Thermoanaerobaculia bacterium]|jgi:CheY-like chemotaxis protein|nr:response regulator [Thermoanaerobaculia bacterium]